MSEYDVLINKYDALNAGYDQLYPKPMKHANTHASGGTDPITPGDIGAYSKNETDLLLSTKVNENLLDNPCLQIAQAGYCALHGSLAFAADRWRMNVLGALELEGITGGGIKLTSRNKYPYIEQFFDTDMTEFLRGKTVTFGCNVLSLVRASDAPAQLFFASNGAIVRMVDFLEAGIHSMTFEVPSNSYSFSVGLYVNAAGGTTGTVMELKCLKLELGSACTIANDVLPDYGEQLRRCKRYFQRTGQGFIGAMTTDTRLYISGRFDVEMRTEPTVTLTSDTPLFYDYGNDINLTNAVLSSYKTLKSGAAYIGIDHSSVSSSGRPICMGNNYLDFSAEL